MQIFTHQNQSFMIRTLLIVAAILTMGAFSSVADENEKKGPVLEFEKSRQDYGTVYVDDLPDGNLKIKFTNTGDEPLVISNVRACCGTRVRDWPREPIMPGDEETIEVSFRLAPRPQRISRTVTVNYNNEERPTVRYRIVGQVVERE